MDTYTAAVPSAIQLHPSAGRGIGETGVKVCKIRGTRAHPGYESGTGSGCLPHPGGWRTLCEGIIISIPHHVHPREHLGAGGADEGRKERAGAGRGIRRGRPSSYAGHILQNVDVDIPA
jgi:hypothetical protein